MSVAFGALAQMPALVNVDFTNNYNLKGSWTGNTTYNTQDSKQVGDRPAAARVTSVMASKPVQSRLLIGDSKEQLAARCLIIPSLKLSLTSAALLFTLHRLDHSLLPGAQVLRVRPDAH